MAQASLYIHAPHETAISKAALLTLTDKVIVVETTLAIDIHTVAKSLLLELSNSENGDCVLRLTLDQANVLGLGLETLYENCTDITQAEEITLFLRKIRKKIDCLLYMSKLN